MANVLIVSPTPFMPTTAGNRERIYKLLVMLESLGHVVYFVHVEREVGDTCSMRRILGARLFCIPYKQPPVRWKKVRRLLQKLNFSPAFRVNIDAWYDSNIEPQIQRIIKDFSIEAVIVEYAYMSKLLESIDDSLLKVVDTHDVFANRHERYIAQGLKPAWLSCSPADERKALNRATKIIAIQEHEATHFRSQIKRSVVTVGHAIDIENATKPGPEKGKRECGRLLYVGSSNPINQISINWFIREVLPLVLQSHEVQLVIVGSICKSIEDARNISLAGVVDSLAASYLDAQVVINPAQFGTGLKIKTIEALAHGRPIVSTAVGADGINNSDGEVFKVADNAEDFCQEIVGILDSPALAKKMSSRAIQFIEEYNRDCLLSLSSIFEETPV